MLRSFVFVVVLASLFSPAVSYAQELYLRILDVKAKKYFNANFVMGEKVKTLVAKVQKPQGLPIGPNDEVAIVYEGKIYRGNDPLIFFPSSEFAFLYYGEKLQDLTGQKIPEVWRRLNKFGLKKENNVLVREPDSTYFSKREWTNFKAGLYFKTLDEQKTDLVFNLYFKHIYPALKQEKLLLTVEEESPDVPLDLLTSKSLLACIQNWILHNIHYLGSPSFDSWKRFASHPYFRGKKLPRSVVIGVKGFLQELQEANATVSYQPFTDPNRLRVLILTSSGWGGGHLTVAQSVEEALRVGLLDSVRPDMRNIDVEILDIKNLTLRPSDSLWSLTQGGMHSIDIYDEIYQKEHDPVLADAFWLVLNELQYYKPDGLMPALKKHISQTKPDMIVSCLHHYTNFIDLAYSFSVPLAIVGTDYGLQGKLYPHVENLNPRLVQVWTPTDDPWYLHHLHGAMRTWNGYFAPDKVRSMDQFMDANLPLDKRWQELSEKMGVFRRLGFPLRKEIKKIANTALIKQYKKDLGVEDSDKAKVVMITMGRQGMGTVIDLTKKLAQVDQKINFPLYLFPLCANNATCFDQLSEFKNAATLKNITLYPQRLLNAEEINKLYNISDLIISKPGGATAAELLEVGKPLAAVDYHPWERDNLDMLKKYGLGIDVSAFLDKPSMADEILKILRKKPGSQPVIPHPYIDWRKNLFTNLVALKDEHLNYRPRELTIMRQHRDDKDTFDLQVNGKNRFNLSRGFAVDGLSDEVKPAPLAKDAPNIVMLFLDTVRRDFLDENELAPVINSFRDKYIQAPHMVASATATQHVQTALFHSIPALYRESLVRNYWSSGSPTLELLKRAGYAIHLLGRPNYYYGITKAQEELIYEAGPWSDVTQLQVMFGQRPSTMLRTAQPLNPAFNDFDKFPMAGGDAHTVEVQLPKLLKSKDSKKPGVYLIFLDAAHDRYSWTNEALLDKDYGRLFEKSLYNNRITRSPEWHQQNLHEEVFKAYRNSLRNTDRNVASIFAKLKESGMFDNSIIALFSDHGERVYDSYANWYEGMKSSETWLYENIGHAGPPFKSVVEVPLAIKPHATYENENVLRTKMYENVISHENIFPTLMHMANVGLPSAQGSDEALLKTIQQRDILNENSKQTCQVTVAPNGVEDPFIIGFVGSTYKAFLHLHFDSYLLDEPDFSQVAIRVDGVTNLNDVAVPVKPNNHEAFFRMHFSDCLTTLGIKLN